MDQYPQYQYQNSYTPTPDPSAGRGHALASLILGIASLVFCWFYGTSIISGIIGIVQSNKAAAAGNISGMRKAGKVMSIIGMILGIIFLILIIIGIAASM